MTLFCIARYFKPWFEKNSAFDVLIRFIFHMLVWNVIHFPYVGVELERHPIYFLKE
jgi:hypothetical protein